MGYNPPPPPLPYPMTRNSVPPPPPPPPPKRIINEGWPSITKPKKKEKKLVDVRDKHGQIRMDVRIDEEGFPIVKIQNPDEDGYLAVKLPKDADHKDVKNVLSQYYSGYTVPSYSNEEYYAKICIDDLNKKSEIELRKMGVRKPSNGMVQIEGNIENSKALSKEEVNDLRRLAGLDYNPDLPPPEVKPWFPPNILVNESTGEVTYDYVSEEQKRQWPQPQLKKDADPPKKKQKEIVKPEPKPEYGEAINIRKKRTRWERFIDRIIKNIVWGK